MTEGRAPFQGGGHDELAELRRLLQQEHASARKLRGMATLEWTVELAPINDGTQGRRAIRLCLWTVVNRPTSSSTDFSVQ